MADTKSLLIACPRCGTRVSWQDNPHRPFCSEKCQLVDLGRWAQEEYSIPGRPVDPEQLANIIEFPRKGQEED